MRITSNWKKKVNEGLEQWSVCSTHVSTGSNLAYSGSRRTSVNEIEAEKGSER